MADSLETLASIIDSIGPLMDMSKGSPLRADSWNALAGAVVELAKLVAAREKATGDTLEARFARNPHVHSGEADLSWFEPLTRSLLEGRIGQGPEMQATLRKVDDQAQALRGELDQLKALVLRVQSRLDSLTELDTAREQGLARFSQRLEALKDVNAQVSEVGSRFARLDEKVTRALQFEQEIASSLGGTGELAAMAKRVNGLETLRDNLVVSDGTLLRAREFEVRLARLETTTVKSSELSDTLATRFKSEEVLKASGLVDAVAGQVRAGFDQRATVIEQSFAAQAQGMAGLRDSVQGTAAQVSALDASLGKTQSDVLALGSLPTDLASFKKDLGALQGSLNSQATTLATLPNLGARLTANEQSLQALASTNTRLDTLDSSVSTLNQTTRDLQLLAPRLGTLESRLGVVEARGDFRDFTGNFQSSLAALEQRVVLSEAALDDTAGLGKRVDQLEGFASTTSSWRTGVDSQLTKVNGVQSAVSDLGTRLTSAENSVSNLTAWQGSSKTTLDLVASHGKSLLELDSRLATTEATSKVLDGRIIGVESRVGKIDGRVVSVEGAVTKFEATKVDDASKQKLLIDRVNALESTTVELATTVKASRLTTNVLRVNG